MGDKIKLSLENFFPSSSLQITEVKEERALLRIHMRSETKTCKCPACHQVSSKYHGTYTRKVQDLPILGKQVWLEITAHEYECENPSCNITTIAETYGGFLDHYSRMTERCADLVATLALETSCEGCARICKEMGIRISGDSVIRLLTKRFQLQEEVKCGSIIGVDDFAFKKRHTYGTIIVDGTTHAPVAILDGRDGQSLKEWLARNKQVKTVTRDRASAYAAAIQEILPDAMQIADRFHLHQNLLEAIKNTINATVPTDIRIPSDYGKEPLDVKTEDHPQSKKNPRHCG